MTRFPFIFKEILPPPFIFVFAKYIRKIRRDIKKELEKTRKCICFSFIFSKPVPPKLFAKLFFSWLKNLLRYVRFYLLRIAYSFLLSALISVFRFALWDKKCNIVVSNYEKYQKYIKTYSFRSFYSVFVAHLQLFVGLFLKG